jgi:hypothetical protein
MGALAPAVGRWHIFVCEACGEATGRHKDCDNARRAATEVVPVDEAAIERAARALHRARGLSDGSFGTDGYCECREFAEAALRAAGKAA